MIYAVYSILGFVFIALQQFVFATSYIDLYFVLTVIVFERYLNRWGIIFLMLISIILDTISYVQLGVHSFSAVIAMLIATMFNRLIHSDRGSVKLMVNILAYVSYSLVFLLIQNNLHFSSIINLGWGGFGVILLRSFIISFVVMVVSYILDYLSVGIDNNRLK